MKCPKCGSEHIGYDDLTIACCTEYHCDWNEFTALTAERDALSAELAALKNAVEQAECALMEIGECSCNIGTDVERVVHAYRCALLRLEEGET